MSRRLIVLDWCSECPNHMVLAVGEKNEIHRCARTDIPIITAVVDEEVQFPAECPLEEIKE